MPPVIVEFPIEETAPTWATDPVSAELALEVADVDGDLEITALDAGLILEYEVQLITVFPVETAPASPATDAVALANPLRASDAYLRPGGRFTISLDASAMRSLQAGELVLGFDSSMLTPVDVAWTGASAVPGGQRPLIAQRAREGQLAIAFASARPIGGSDATLEVTFEAARNVVQPRESEIRAFHLRLNASRIATDFVFPFRVEPFQTRLMANYPNPFNPETWIPFELAADSDVTLRIYGLDGKIVRTLELGYRPMGEYRARESAAYWDGRNEIGERVASGLYVYELQAGDQRAVRRMVISK